MTEIHTRRGPQETFDSTLPIAGDMWKNIHSGELVCVLAILQRRGLWVEHRDRGHIRKTPLDIFLTHYQSVEPPPQEAA